MTESLPRREALRLLALGCGLALVPGAASRAAGPEAGVPIALEAAPGAAGLTAAAWNALAFAATTQAEALRALGLAGPLQPEDARVQLRVPELAENGAVVPVSVHARLAGVQRVVLLVPRNPNLLAADFRLSAPVTASVATRLKLAETGPVLALVQAAEGVFLAQGEVKVTTGGCGG